jgi:hypothetical protein
MIPTNVIGVVVTAYADRKESQQEEQNDQRDAASTNDGYQESPNVLAPKVAPDTSNPTTPASKNP